MMVTIRKRAAAAAPVQRLREQVKALQAAIALAITAPTRKPVHTVRTCTRRIEALLELLHWIEGDAEAGETLRVALRRTAKVRRLLRKVRKAAGRVRDLDMQTEMLNTTSAGAKRKGLLKEGEKLGSFLKERRRREAEALVKELEGHAAKLGSKLDATLKRLEPVAMLTLTDEHLVEIARGWYEAAMPGGTGVETQDRLHLMRKRAKLARYIAEGGGRKSLKLAEEFQRLQESGGRWHDSLTVAATAKKRLGKEAVLVSVFRSQEEDALAAFRSRLAEGAQVAPHGQVAPNGQVAQDGHAKPDEYPGPQVEDD